MSDFDNDIGRRIAELRRGVWTQKSLADAIGMSVDTIRKIEQGSRVPTVSTLRKIAGELGVPMRDFYPAGQQDLATQRNVAAIRVAVTSVDDLTEEVTGEPANVSEVERLASYAFSLYWTGHIEEALAVLPEAITRARATARDLDTAAAHTTYVRSLMAAGIVLSRVGEGSIAYAALRAGIAAAPHAGDPLLAAQVHTTLAWQIQADSRWGEAARIVVRVLDGLADEDHPAALAVRGSLAGFVAAAAAKGNDMTLARSSLEEATVIADRLGGDRTDYETNFGPTLVKLHAAEVAHSEQDYDGAVKTFAQISPSASITSTVRCWALGVRASAHQHLGNDNAALSDLDRIDRLSSDYLRADPLIGITLSEIVTKEQRRIDRSKMMQLARKIDVNS